MSIQYFVFVCVVQFELVFRRNGKFVSYRLSYRPFRSLDRCGQRAVCVCCSAVEHHFYACAARQSLRQHHECAGRRGDFITIAFVSGSYFIQCLSEIGWAGHSSPTICHIIRSLILNTFQCHTLDSAGLHLFAHYELDGGADVLETKAYSLFEITGTAFIGHYQVLLFGSFCRNGICKCQVLGAIWGRGKYVFGSPCIELEFIVRPRPVVSLVCSPITSSLGNVFIEKNIRIV